MADIWRYQGRTQRTIVAAHDQTISTKYFKNKVLKEESGSKCCLCKQHEELLTAEQQDEM
jgi:hypothetical protein